MIVGENGIKIGRVCKEGLNENENVRIIIHIKNMKLP